MTCVESFRYIPVKVPGTSSSRYLSYSSYRRTAFTHACFLFIHTLFTRRIPLSAHRMRPDTITASANQGKRTNSLAFAQSDCHTCTSTGEHCDRRRPQCSTCLSLGRKCGGFATPLSWDSRRMWTKTFSATHDDTPSGENTKNNSAAFVTSQPDSATSGLNSNSTMPAPRRPFRFVTAGSKPRKRRRTRNDGGTRTVESQAVEYRDEAVTGTDAEILPEGVSEEDTFRTGDAQSGEDLANHEPGKGIRYDCDSGDKLTESVIYYQRYSTAGYGRTSL